ncbi:MAG: indole-3-glycerol phosphate synthase TrpC [Chthoniobacterales bacterium]|nr:indole-3-glycerol phosphate synthase TrpC [Chthoniobacterales bacterium]
MNRLEDILRMKRAEVARLQAHQDELRRAGLDRTDFRGFASALKRESGNLSLIAEIKKASPSAGVIVESFDPVAIAKSYARAGAKAISVLTDEQFFQGHLGYLADVRRVVGVPLLRKDFIIDAVQIAESAAAGADAILLIVAALAQEDLLRFIELAAVFQLETVVEVHTLDELERALDADAQIVGINNRDLATFEVDLGVTERLSEEVPDEVILISESGLRTRADLERIKKCGVDAVLMGEALMRGGSGAIENLKPRGD